MNDLTNEVVAKLASLYYCIPCDKYVKTGYWYSIDNRRCMECGTVIGFSVGASIDKKELKSLKPLD